MFNVEKQLFHWRHRKVNGREVNICARLLVGGLLIFFATFVPAAPLLNRVDTGASVSASGTTTTVDQGTAVYSHLTWDSFDTAAGETVRFKQLRSAVSVNKILGNTAGAGGPTLFFGTLNADGTVFLINNAGITFGAGAQVNVGALLATTSDVNFDRQTGIATLSGGAVRSNAAIRNDGAITASEGGFAILVAPRLDNTGAVSAPLGQVSLVSASDATLKLAGSATASGFAVDLRGDGVLGFSVDPATLGAGWQGAAGVSSTGSLKGREILVSAGMAQNIVTSAINLDGLVDASAIENGVLTGVADSASVAVTGTGDIGLRGTTLRAQSENGGMASVVIESTGGRVTGGPGANGAPLSVSVDAGGGSASGMAEMRLQAGGDILWDGDITVTAGAFGSSASGSPVGSANASASLDVRAGKGAAGGSLTLNGNIDVSAAAGVGSSASTGSASAIARATLVGQGGNTSVNRTRGSLKVHATADSQASGTNVADATTSLLVGGQADLYGSSGTFAGFGSAQADGVTLLGGSVTTAAQATTGSSWASASGFGSLGGGASGNSASGVTTLAQNATLVTGGTVDIATSGLDVSASAGGSGEAVAGAFFGAVSLDTPVAGPSLRHHGGLTVSADTSGHSGSGTDLAVSLALFASPGDVDISAGGGSIAVGARGASQAQAGLFMGGDGYFNGPGGSGSGSASGGVSQAFSGLLDGLLGSMSSASHSGDLLLDGRFEVNAVLSPAGAAASGRTRSLMGAAGRDVQVTANSNIRVTADTRGSGSQFAADASAQAAFQAFNWADAPNAGNLDFAADLLVSADAVGGSRADASARARADLYAQHGLNQQAGSLRVVATGTDGSASGSGSGSGHQVAADAGLHLTSLGGPINLDTPATVTAGADSQGSALTNALFAVDGGAGPIHLGTPASLLQVSARSQANIRSEAVSSLDVGGTGAQSDIVLEGRFLTQADTLNNGSASSALLASAQADINVSGNSVRVGGGDFRVTANAAGGSATSALADAALSMRASGADIGFSGDSLVRATADAAGDAGAAAHADFYSSAGDITIQTGTTGISVISSAASGSGNLAALSEFNATGSSGHVDLRGRFASHANVGASGSLASSGTHGGAEADIRVSGNSVDFDGWGDAVALADDGNPGSTYWASADAVAKVGFAAKTGVNVRGGTKAQAAATGASSAWASADQAIDASGDVFMDGQTEVMASADGDAWGSAVAGFSASGAGADLRGSVDTEAAASGTTWAKADAGTAVNADGGVSLQGRFKVAGRTNQARGSSASMDRASAGMQVSGAQLAVAADVNVDASALGEGDAGADAAIGLSARGADGQGTAINLDSRLASRAMAAGAAKGGRAHADTTLSGPAGDITVTGAGALTASASGSHDSATAAQPPQSPPVDATVSLTGARLRVHGPVAAEAVNRAGGDDVQAVARMTALNNSVRDAIRLDSWALPQARVTGSAQAGLRSGRSRYQDCSGGGCGPVSDGVGVWTPGHSLAQIELNGNIRVHYPREEDAVNVNRELGSGVAADPGMPGGGPSRFEPNGDLVVGLNFELGARPGGETVAAGGDFDPNALPATAAGDGIQTYCDQFVNGGCEDEDLLFSAVTP